MKVKNKKYIYNLSFKTLKRYKQRNIIAISAIALTSVLFTSVFTVFFSINTTYQNHTFRQIGGYAHGTFKSINEKHISSISNHSKVKDVGLVSNIGTISDGVFLKNNAEIKYMDDNKALWSFCIPKNGFRPQKANEIALDTRALDLLGVKHKIGERVKIRFQVDTSGKTEKFISADFILSGYWDYDELLPVHFILISKAYLKEIESEMINEGFQAFRMDLDVMLTSSVNVRNTMEKIEADLGFQFKDRVEDNFIPIGVNWAYTSNQISAFGDISSLLSVCLFLFLILLTGFLVIYNVFQISVNEDIRYYGLLKTIGMTSKQLRKIVRLHALTLSFVGIPIGLLIGYIIGIFVMPMIIAQSNLSYNALTISPSPFIFLGSAIFSFFTVFFSCNRPAKIAGKVSPVEAVRYCGSEVSKNKKRKTSGSKIYQMAFANILRNKKKVILILCSLSFSVLLFFIVFTFVKGMDDEKYLNKTICSDFIVGDSSYFHFRPNKHSSLDKSLIEYIRDNTKQGLQGSAYRVSDSILCNCRLDKDYHILIQGLDDDLFSKLSLIEGSLSSLKEGAENMIAIVVYEDDYGNIVGGYPKIGDIMTVTYKDKQSENIIMYKIAALVKVPYSMGTRFRIQNSYKAILHSSVLQKDSGAGLKPMFYLFDAFDKDSELQAEMFLKNLSENINLNIMYESKALARKKFNKFRSVFFILGSSLCFVLGFIGLLNFFNGLMTDILSRQKEIAVLKAIGMTDKQLKHLLIYESLYISAGIIICSFAFILFFDPIFGNLMQKIFWFFTYKFSLSALYIISPIFIIISILLPVFIYTHISKNTIIEQLRRV